MMSAYSIDLTDSPVPGDVRAIEKGLGDYNQSMGIEWDWLSLAVFIRDGDGTVVGGLTGGTYWGWLYVSILWLSEQVRGQGYGSQLLSMAENEARQRGCQHAFVDTTSFQALPFYQKSGYILYAQLDDFPPGHSRYFLRKPLVASDSK